MRERLSPCANVVTVLDSILLALNFFAVGTIQIEVATMLRTSQPSVCRAIREVTDALASIAHEYICLPPNLLEVILLQRLVCATK